MSKKRAITLTNSEISTIIWVLSLLFAVIAVVIMFNMIKPAWANSGVRGGFMLAITLIVMSLLFGFGSMALPNYLISKHNLNLFIDRISNPDYIGWIRFTRNKKVSFQIVKTGPLGQTKGMAAGNKADVINTGEYTITTTNGNQAILVSDLLSTNINLTNAMGWNLIKKHFGLVGYRAYEKAIKDKEVVFNDEGEGSDGKI